MFANHSRCLGSYSTASQSLSFSAEDRLELRYLRSFLATPWRYRTALAARTRHSDRVKLRSLNPSICMSKKGHRWKMTICGQVHMGTTPPPPRTCTDIEGQVIVVSPSVRKHLGWHYGIWLPSQQIKYLQSRSVKLIALIMAPPTSGIGTWSCQACSNWQLQWQQLLLLCQEDRHVINALLHDRGPRHPASTREYHGCMCSMNVAFLLKRLTYVAVLIYQHHKSNIIGNSTR